MAPSHDGQELDLSPAVILRKLALLNQEELYKRIEEDMEKILVEDVPKESIEVEKPNEEEEVKKKTKKSKKSMEVIKLVRNHLFDGKRSWILRIAFPSGFSDIAGSKIPCSAPIEKLEMLPKWSSCSQ